MQNNKKNYLCVKENSSFRVKTWEVFPLPWNTPLLWFRKLINVVRAIPNSLAAARADLPLKIKS